MEISVLHVDDDPGVLDITKNWLERGSIRVTDVKDPEEALNKLEGDHDFDLVLSDYKMPGMNGLDLLKRIRENWDLPFIIFTGKGREEVAIKALNLGADRYIKKGEDPESQFAILRQAIRESVEKERIHVKYQKVFRGNPEPMVYLNKHFRVEDVNEEFERLFGFSLDGINGEEINDLIVPSNKMEEAKNLDAKTFDGFKNFTTYRKNKEGRLIPVSISSTPLEFNEKIIGIIVTYQDISSIKEKEKNLKKVKSRFERLFNDLGDIVFITRSEGEILEVNETACEELGYSREELLGQNLLSDLMVGGADNLENFNDRLEDLKNGETILFESSLNRKDNNSIPIEVNASLIQYEGGKAILAVNRDISKRKKFKEFKDRIADDDKIGLYARRPTGEIEYVNNKFSGFLNLCKEDLIGKNYFELIGKVPHESESVIRDEFNCGKNNEDLILKVDEFRANNEIYGTVIDITERKKLESQLKSRDEEMIEFIDSIPIQVARLSSPTEFKLVNDEFASFRGLTKDDILENSMNEISDSVSNLDRFIERNKESFKGKKVFNEVWTKSDGDKRFLRTLRRPIYNGSDVECIIYSAMDITDQRKLGEKLIDKLKTKK